MKWLVFLVCLPAFATSPILIHTSGSENSRAANVSGTSTFEIPTAEPAIAGNCLGAAVRWSTAGAIPSGITISDDKSDTAYAVYGSLVQDATNSFAGQIWIFPSVTVGAHYITIVFGGTGGAAIPLVQMIAFEVADCGSTSGAITDGSTSNISTGTTASAGAMTVGTSGDLLLHFGWVDTISTQPALTSFSVGSQANITWLPQHVELLDGELLQYGDYSSTGSFTPQMTVSSATVMNMAIAIKGASGGGVPSGVTVNSIQHLSLCYGTTAYCSNGVLVPSPNPSVTQFPLKGNLLVAVQAAGCDITSITYGSTVMTKRLTYTGTGASETEQVFDILNNTPNNANTFSIVPNATGCTGQTGFAYDYTVVIYDITSPTSQYTWAFDTSSNASGQVTSCSSPCTLAGASITPGDSLCILLADISEWFNSVSGVAGPWIGDTMVVSPLYQFPAWDQNNGFAHYENTGTSSESTTWDYIDTSGSFPQGYWASVIASYKATANGAPPPPFMCLHCAVANAVIP